MRRSGRRGRWRGGALVVGSILGALVAACGVDASEPRVVVITPPPLPADPPAGVQTETHAPTATIAAPEAPEAPPTKDAGVSSVAVDGDAGR